MARESIETGSRTLGQMSGALASMSHANQSGINGIQNGINSFTNILLANHARVQRDKELKRAEDFRQKEFDFNKENADRNYKLGLAKFEADEAAQNYANITARINANSNAAMNNERIRMTNNKTTRLLNEIAYENTLNEYNASKAAQKKAQELQKRKPLSAFFGQGSGNGSGGSLGLFLANTISRLSKAAGQGSQ